MTCPHPLANQFLQTARQLEARELQHLLDTARLTASISALIHALQLERGSTHMWLCSDGRLFSDQLLPGALRVDQAQACLRAMLTPLLLQPEVSGSSRFFTRAAMTLSALDRLVALRQQVQQRAIKQPVVMAQFNEIICQLLGLVFETADAATQADVSRALIAMFSFMQGKELAGQERALGAAGFACGLFTSQARQQLIELIDGQSHCFTTFGQFAQSSLVARFQQVTEENSEFERLRRIACTRQSAISPDEVLAQTWFELYTRRINHFKVIEDQLVEALMCCCRDCLARTENASEAQHLAALMHQPDAGGYSLFVSDAQWLQQANSSTLPTDGLSSHLSHSLLSLIQQQSYRLQQLAEELASVRASLDERKIIEQAKQLLIRHQGYSEQQAHKQLRSMAMNQNKRMVEIATAMLSVADLFGHSSS